MKSPAKILIQAIGNPLRSDDALGPLLIERLSDESVHHFEYPMDLEWVYQLQIENAEQWRHYEFIIIVDADAQVTDSLSWRELTKQTNGGDEAFDSHRKSPEFIYRLMQQCFETKSTPLSTRVFVLGIQAENFEIGEHLSNTSQRAFKAAEKYLVHLLSQGVQLPNHLTMSTIDIIK